MDWSNWSRESVSLMATRTRELLDRHGIPPRAAYRWDLETATLVIGGVELHLVTVGTVANDSFLWAWANEAIPAAAKAGIERVRQFGIERDLGLLVEPCVPGGLAQAKECLALAARILDASGCFIDPTNEGFIVFALRELD
jgi:hypothetical protein